MRRALSLILMLAMLASLFAALPLSASAEPSRAGCTGPKSPDGQHVWIGRPIDPWCTRGGGIVYVCQYCQKEVLEETTPALGHDWGRWDELSRPDCTHTGERIRYCLRCQARDLQTVPATGHSWGPWEVIDAPTCTQDGSRQRVCVNCGEYDVEELPATGHDPVAVPGREPTCTQPGLTEGAECSVCGMLFGSQWEIEPLGHDYQISASQAATCTAPGITTYTCSRCGDSYSIQDEQLDHTPITVPAVAATCTAGGKTEGRKCAVCGTILSQQQDTPALGHSWDGGKVTAKATCTQDGVRTYTCSRCGNTRTEAIAKTGHTPVSIPGKAATCTEAGLTEGSKCSVCGTVLTAQSAIPAKGHNYQVTASKEPTATEDGYRTYTCSNCKDSYTEKLPKVAHTHNYQVTKDQAATCTDQGSKTYACSICGDSYTETSSALGHAWGDWATETTGSCAQQGSQVRSCSRCGATERRSTDYGPHSWGEWKQIKAPTATEPGLEQRVCKITASHQEQREIPPTGEEFPAAPDGKR